MDPTPRVLIAEYHTLMAEGLRKLLECEFPSVRIVENGQELLSVAADFQPDVVLMDIGMPALNGFEAARRLSTILPSAKILVVTAHDEAERVVEAFRAGAIGYILKRCAVSELVLAIKQVLSGKSYVTPRIAEHAVASRPLSDSPKGSRPLTERQREVLRLVAEGLTAKEIANLLHLSAKTAVFHKMAIMDKLGLRTTAELTRYALEHGIVSSRFRPIPLRLPVASSLDVAPNERIEVEVQSPIVIEEQLRAS